MALSSTRLFLYFFAAISLVIVLASCLGTPTRRPPLLATGAIATVPANKPPHRTAHAEKIFECFNTLQGTWRDHHWPYHVVVFRDSMVYEFDTAGNLTATNFLVADGVLRHKGTGQKRIFQYLVRYDMECYRYRLDYLDTDSMHLRTTCTWDYCCDPEEENIIRILTRVENGRR